MDKLASKLLTANKKTKYLCATCMPKYKILDNNDNNVSKYSFTCDCCGRNIYCPLWNVEELYPESGDEKDILKEGRELSKELHEKPIPPYMKQLNITLQEAKNIWPDLRDKTYGLNFVEAHIKELILKTWSEDELEEKEGYTFDESFSGEGWYIAQENGEIRRVENYTHKNPKFPNCSGINLFKTKEQAESALAFAQLSHIVAKSNEKETDDGRVYFIYRNTDDDLVVGDTKIFKHLGFRSATSAMNSLKLNYQLWVDYWQLNYLKDKK